MAKKTISAFNNIHALRKRYYAALPGKEALISVLAEAEVADQVYNSNAIENSTLSLEETEKILLQIDLDRYISERELFEAKNLARVVSYIQNRAKEQELNEEMILSLHHMLLANISDDIAGRFRRAGEYVKVGNHIAPAPEKIERGIESMFAEFTANADMHIVRRISHLHLAFENLHPFCDGNGRIGRVINNYILLREGYVPINIKFIDRKKYYDAFKQYDQHGVTDIMEEIMAKALTNSYHRRLAYLEGKRIVTLSQYAKEMKLSASNSINKAHRQTIEAFLEKGVWKIGIDD